MAGQVLWHCTMSLDGFVAGPDDDMSWLAELDFAPDLVQRYVAGLGAVIGGRRGWDATIDDARPYGGVWTGPIFVLTQHPEDARPRPDVSFLNCDVAEAIDIARDAAGGKDVEILSADIARQAILRGLVDACVFHLAPIMLGDGVRVFAQAGIDPIHWRRVEADTAHEVVDLRYQPVR